MSLVTPIQRGIASAGASASVSTTVAAVHLDKQVLLPSFIPLLPTSSWLVYATSLARNASAVCALRLETVMMYARFMRITSRRFVGGWYSRIQVIFIYCAKMARIAMPG